MRALLLILSFFSFFNAEAAEYQSAENIVVRSQNKDHLIANALDRILEKALSSTCIVYNRRSDWSPFSRWWYGDAGGTAFFISSHGYLITNKHVVEGDSAPFVYVNSEKSWFEASVIAIHPTEDVALLKIDYFSHFSYLELSSHSGEVGDWIFALRGRGFSPWSGQPLVFPSIGKIISDEHSFSMAVASIAVVPGNSGSPVLNLNGNVVGIVTLDFSFEATPNLGASGITSVDQFKDWLNQYL